MKFLSTLLISTISFGSLTAIGPSVKTKENFCLVEAVFKGERVKTKEQRNLNPPVTRYRVFWDFEAKKTKAFIQEKCPEGNFSIMVRGANYVPNDSVDHKFVYPYDIQAKLPTQGAKVQLKLQYFYFKDSILDEEYDDYRPTDYHDGFKVL